MELYVFILLMSVSGRLFRERTDLPLLCWLISNLTDVVYPRDQEDINVRGQDWVRTNNLER